MKEEFQSSPDIGQSGLRNWGSASQRWAWSSEDLGFHLAPYINSSVFSLKYPNLSEPQFPPVGNRELHSLLTFQRIGERLALPLLWPWERGAIPGRERVPWASRGLAGPSPLQVPAQPLPQGPLPSAPIRLQGTFASFQVGATRTGARPDHTICLNGNAAQVWVWGTGNC